MNPKTNGRQSAPKTPAQHARELREEAMALEAVAKRLRAAASVLDGRTGRKLKVTS